LDAGASSDPEGAVLSYAWSQTSGPGVALDDPTSVAPAFTAPSPVAATTLRFVVRAHDGHQVSSPATTTVVVGAVPNQIPVADAGSDTQVDEGSLVTLDGSGSRDPDNTPFTFAWSQDSGPGVTLDDPASKSPSFTAPQVDADSLVVLALVVSDGVANSAPAHVNVLVRDLPVVEPLPADVAEAPPAEVAGAEPEPEVAVEPAEPAGDDVATSEGGGSGCSSGRGGGQPIAPWLMLASLALLVSPGRRRAARLRVPGTPPAGSRSATPSSRARRTPRPVG
jgi:hypothetical protein